MEFLKLDDLISDTNADLKFKAFTFNGGEQHISIEQLPKMDYEPLIKEATIEVSFTNSSKLMLTFMATDALRRMGFEKINLFAPYLPYARQDRVCNPGEALSIKVICDIINSQNYNKVWTLDNHSDVSTALLNNHVPINLTNILDREYSMTHMTLVSPDGGSLKKVYTLAKFYGGLDVIECSKKRDTKFGAITETVVYHGSLESYNNLLIIDDIADGGRTFIELAQALRRKGAKKICLFVSHGIFSKGLEVFNGLIDFICTTRSFKNEITDKIGIPFKLGDINA